MKRSKRCPECAGTNIRMTKVPAGGRHAPDLLPGAHPWWRRGTLEVYVCCTCGYFQYFVPEEALSKVVESSKFQVVR